MMKTKNLILLTLCVLISSSVYAQDSVYMNKYNDMMDRTTWFRESRFGMFIHWGPYAIPARGEWVKSVEKITTEDYQKYVDAFIPSNYNPEDWAQLAKDAGMKYAVMTAKHHDGFCMFDSKYTDYKITTNVPGRDYIKEYLEAFRQKGLKVGLYYSLLDWYHKDFPNTRNHPMRDNPDYNTKKYNWENYLDYMFKQIEELMTNYGKIDILWLDFSFDDYYGEKWKANELVKMIKKYQPDIILNNRLVINHGTSSEPREFSGYGDFETPEQGIPEKMIVDIYENEIPWETCLTLNNSWGFNSSDDQWKTKDLIIRSLLNCVSKNGNLLLNVGPDSQGTIPEQTKEILLEVGEWLSINGESIYGCKNSSYAKPNWGYFTQSGNVLYAHVTSQPVGHINLKEIGENVKEVYLLATSEKAATANNWWGYRSEGNFFINIKEPTYLTYVFPDKTDTVFKVILMDNNP